MAKNYAITIGINQYEHIPRPLKYAAGDAEKIRDFLLNEAKFDQVFYYSDYSPVINGASTRPSRANLLRLLEVTFSRKFMESGDNFWFFFSGHGARVEEVDYLIPSDGFIEDVKNSAISVNYVIQRLQRCGADNVILILDACREQESGGSSKSIKGLGEQTQEEARQTGVISICSCSPNEYSWELDELQQGIFTYALLEGLGSKGRSATVKKLNDYLRSRVKELAQKKGRQTPRVMADPIEKSHLILMPKYATTEDIAILKNDAMRAEINGEFKKARQLWIRVLTVSLADQEAIDGIVRIEKISNTKNLTFRPPRPPNSVSNKKSHRATSRAGYLDEKLKGSKSLSDNVMRREDQRTIGNTNSYSRSANSFQNSRNNSILVSLLKRTWVLQILVLGVWFFISFLTFTIDSNPNRGELLTILFILGAVAGAITGLLEGLAVKILVSSTKQEDVFLKHPLIGLFLGGLSWYMIGRVLGTSQMRYSEKTVGLISGLVAVSIALLYLYMLEKKSNQRF